MGDLVRQARAEVALTGPDGLLKALTQDGARSPLQMTEHLGYDPAPQPGVEVETRAADLVTRR